MPLVFVPMVFFLHVAIFAATAFFGVTFAINKKISAEHANQTKIKAEADARSRQVHNDIEANNKAKEFFVTQQQLLKEVGSVSPVVPLVMGSLPESEKVVRLSLRRADDASKKGEMLLRVDMVNEGPITSTALRSFQEMLIKKGVTPVNMASRSDSKKNYFEGRIYIKGDTK